MKICYLSWIAMMLMACCISCKDSKRATAENLVTEWIGKEIVFPPAVGCSYMGQDTVCPDINNAPHKILVYTDSVGCTSCKLNLHVWKMYMEEIDSIMPDQQVEFLFYFQPRNKKELEHLLKRDRLNQTVFIDTEGEISQLNDFPREMEYQCFLLGRDNKVLSIGNPVLNPKIWGIYKQLITNTE